MGVKHQDLVGAAAVHPFAFVQATDPALDADNDVTAFKAWIDTSASNALKLRNADNDAWLTIISGAAQAAVVMVGRSYIQKAVTGLPGNSFIDTFFDTYELTYV